MAPASFDIRWKPLSYDVHSCGSGSRRIICAESLPTPDWAVVAENSKWDISKIYQERIWPQFPPPTACCSSGSVHITTCPFFYLLFILFVFGWVCSIDEVAHIGGDAAHRVLRVSLFWRSQHYDHSHREPHVPRVWALPAPGLRWRGDPVPASTTRLFSRQKLD